MKKIVLASASPRRSELLKQIGLSFEVKPSNIEENIDYTLQAEQIAETLSYEKALSTAKGLDRDCLVIGADTIVVKDAILGKPEDEEHAFNMLKSLQGDWHEVITGLTIIDSENLNCVRTFERTRVKMKELSDDTIRAYIKTGEPMDKAGAYGIQGMGAVLIDKIEGCYFNVVGLPLSKLSSVLEEFDIGIL